MIACFQAGTPVHTNQGLMPIENIRVGTQILTQDGSGEAACYQPVWRTVAQLAQAVYAVQIFHADAEVSTLFVTPDTPFQIEDTSSSAPCPVAANALQPGQTLFLTGGRKAQVKLSAPVLHTQHAQYGFAADANTGIRIVVDLSERQLQLADASIAQTLGWLESREPVQVPVYHFDVQKFSTCYVGDAGVWVHANLRGQAAEAATLKADVEAKCFPGETMIRTLGGTPSGDGTWSCGIEEVEVGDYVLSRDELTGEVAYKCVTKVYCNGFKPVFPVHIEYSSEFRKRYPTITSLQCTLEHPFWVEGKGWTKVCDLQIGDMFLMFDGDKAVFKGLGEKEPYATDVFTIEVEGFHSYFAGFAGLWVYG